MYCSVFNLCLLSRSNTVNHSPIVLFCFASFFPVKFDKVDRFDLKQKKQKNKQMIKNYLLSAAARVQAEELRMQSISSQQQRVVQLQQHQQQRKLAPPSLSQSQQPNNNKRFTIQDIHYQADHRLRLAQMQRMKVVEIERQKQQQEMQRRKVVEIERQKKQEHEMIIKHQQKAFVVQELQTRSQQLQELIQREQQRQFLQLHQQETQRKIELKRQEQEQQNEQRHQDALEEREQQNEQYHQDTMEEQERHTRCQKLCLLRNPLKLEHQRQLELIHKEQQRQLKQHVQLQLERKLQHQLTQLRRQQPQQQHQQQQFPHSANAVEDLQNTLHLITRSRSNTDETTPPPPPQPKEVGSGTSLYGTNNEFLLNKKPNILNDALTNHNAYMTNKQRTLESLLFAANVPKNNNKNNDYGNLVSAPNSFNNINNANKGKASNYALTAAIAAAASAAVGVSDNINHSMIPFSTAVAPPKHHPIANETYESKDHGGYGSSGDDSKTSSLVF
jgi:hypothetical protein